MLGLGVEHTPPISNELVPLHIPATNQKVDIRLEMLELLLAHQRLSGRAYVAGAAAPIQEPQHQAI